MVQYFEIKVGTAEHEATIALPVGSFYVYRPKQKITEAIHITIIGTQENYRLLGETYDEFMERLRAII